MHFISQLHASEFGADLRTGELLKFLLSRENQCESSDPKDCDHCQEYPPSHRDLRHVPCLRLRCSSQISGGRPVFAARPPKAGIGFLAPPFFRTPILRSSRQSHPSRDRDKADPFESATCRRSCVPWRRSRACRFARKYRPNATCEFRLNLRAVELFEFGGLKIESNCREKRSHNPYNLRSHRNLRSAHRCVKANPARPATSTAAEVARRKIARFKADDLHWCPRFFSPPSNLFCCWSIAAVDDDQRIRAKQTCELSSSPLPSCRARRAARGRA
jgi:hypothetical protein